MAAKKKAAPTEAQLQNPRTTEQFRLALRRKTRALYDIQELRLAMQGRLTKKAPGISIELHPDDLAKLQGRTKDLELAEKNALADLTDHLNETPFYRDVIAKNKEKYKGLGPRMASIIISSFDIAREDTVSKMWSFAGLAPIPAIRCRRCSVVLQTSERKTLETDNTYENLRGVEWFHHPKPQGNKCEFAGGQISHEETFHSGKQMRPVAGEKLRYNAWLRTKLCGVLATVLLQLKSPYRVYYDNRKQYNLSRSWGTNDAHRHQDAMRYMIKMLLLDIWKEWRAFEGLPVRGSYAEEKLGHITSMKPIGTPRSTPPPMPLGKSLDELAAEEAVREAMEEG